MCPDIYKQPCLYEINAKLWDRRPLINLWICTCLCVFAHLPPTLVTEEGVRGLREEATVRSVRQSCCVSSLCLRLQQEKCGCSPAPRPVISQPRWAEIRHHVLLVFPKLERLFFQSHLSTVFSSLYKTNTRSGSGVTTAGFFFFPFFRKNVKSCSFMTWPLKWHHLWLVTGSCSRCLQLVSRTLCSFNEALLFRAKLLTIDLFWEFRLSITSSYFLI